jgi:transposase
MQGKAAAAPTIHVGIDVSKAHLDVHLHPLGERLRVANDPDGHRRLCDRLGRHVVALVVMEPTARYHRAVHRLLHEAGFKVALVPPLRARLFARACGQPAKTDAIDAAMLASMGQRLAPEPVAPPTPTHEAIQELAAARQAAVAERVAIENRRAAATDAFLRRELATRLRAITGHIQRLDARLAEQVHADPVLDRKARILRSIPGIGPVTTIALIAQLGELGRLSAKQAAALAGLAPFARDSGTTHPKRHIHGGRAALRTALYMAALVATRHNPDLKRFYQTLVQRGKPAKIALTAIARKLVVLANSLVANNRPWTLVNP